MYLFIRHFICLCNVVLAVSTWFMFVYIAIKIIYLNHRRPTLIQCIRHFICPCNAMLAVSAWFLFCIKLFN